MAHQYDTTTGHLFRRYPEDFVKFVVDDTAENIKLADPILKEVRYADATAYATIGLEDGTKFDVIVHIEFQTDSDDTMPIRMAGYIGRLIDMYQRPVYAAVIYLRPQEEPDDSEDVDDPGVYQYKLPQRFVAEYDVIRIWEFDGEEILAKRILGLLPFTPLMQPEGVSDRKWMEKCVRTIQKAVPNEQDRKDVLASTSILAGLVHDVNFVKNFVSEEIMRQSSVVKDIVRKERIYSKIEDTISVLEIRFGDVDDAIKNSLVSIQEEDTLNFLLRQSAIAPRKADIEKKILALSA